MKKTVRKDWRYWLRLLAVGLVGGITIAYGGIEIIYIDAMTRPVNSPVCCHTPQDMGSIYEDISLTSQDGVKLSGWYIPSQNGAVVLLLHGYGAQRTEMLPRAVILAQSGYGVMLYDLRGHGESSETIRAFGWQDDIDVFAALDYLENRPEVDINRIGILGFSVGGQIAIRAAAQDKRISAIIADDPGFVTVADAPQPQTGAERFMYVQTWIDTKGIQFRSGINPPLGVVERISAISPRPILYIASGDGFPLAQHYYHLSGEPKDLWHIPEAGHGGQIVARPEEYEQRMIEFFNFSLLQK